MTHIKIKFLSNSRNGGIAIYNRRFAKVIREIHYANAEVCYYSFRDFSTSNKTLLYKQLKGLLDENEILCLTERIELETINYYKLKNRVLYFLHGDYNYYYSNCQRFSTIIDSFCCVSESIAYNLKQLLPDREQDIYVIKTVIDIHNNSPKTIIPKVIFVGRAEKEKGFDIIPSISDELEKQGFIVNFDLCYPEETKLSRLIKETNKENIKHYIGLDESQIQEIYKNNRIIILPSLAEGLPLVIIEAMAQGLVPITSNIDGLKQYMNNCGIQVNSNNPKDYCQKIIWLLSNPNIYEMYSKNCLQIIINNFSTTESLNTFSDILNSNIRQKKFMDYKSFASRLDRPYIPDFIVKYIRKSKTH